MRYRDAGVDIPRAEALKESLRHHVRTTWGVDVRPLERGFAGVMRYSGAGEGASLLMATMDGVGTKLHVALACGRASDSAADLVYHTANDLLVHGGRPLAFLDYVAQARLDWDVVLAVVEGLSRACREVGAVLLGGETAEMPDTYVPGVVDLAGCMIGAVGPRTLIDGSAVRAGDVLIGLGSTGLHTNGYSLARRVLARSGLSLDSPVPGGNGERLGEALLEPHRWYGPALHPPVEAGRIHALAHVTGGGIAGNLERVLPVGIKAVVRGDAWPRPPLVRWICRAGEVPEEDARSSLNLGIGMVVVCAPAEAPALARDLAAAGETVFDIGVVMAGERGVEWVGTG